MMFLQFSMELGSMVYINDGKGWLSDCVMWELENFI
jgi:hypothetical protein